MLMIGVTGEKVKCTNTEVLLENSVGVPIYLSFDEVWDRFHKTILFRCGAKNSSISLDEKEVCTIPNNLLVAGKVLYVGVYGRPKKINSDPTEIMLTGWHAVGTIRKGVTK